MKTIKIFIFTFILWSSSAFAIVNPCTTGYVPQLVSQGEQFSVYVSGDYINAQYGTYKFPTKLYNYSNGTELFPFLTSDSVTHGQVTITEYYEVDVPKTYEYNQGVSGVKAGGSLVTTWWFYYTKDTYSCVPDSPIICDDGGPSLNGSCDRTCEDIGLVSHETFSMVIAGTSSFGRKTICINNDAEFSDEGQNYAQLNNNTNVSNQTSFDEALQRCTNQCGEGNVASMSNSGDCACISTNSDSTTPNSNPVQNVNTTQVTENTTNVTQNTTNNTQTSQTVQDKVLNYSYNDSELTDADLQKIIDDIQVGNEIANNTDNNVQDLNNNVVSGFNQVNQNLGEINGSLIDSLNFEKDKLQKDFEESEKEVQEAEDEIEKMKGKDQQQEEDMLSFLNGLLEDYNNYKQQLDQIESTMGNGFNANFSGGGVAGGCMQVSAFGATYNLDPCSYISEMSPVISVFVQLMFVLLSIKIVFFGLSNFRLMR